MVESDYDDALFGDLGQENATYDTYFDTVNFGGTPKHTTPYVNSDLVNHMKTPISAATNPEDRLERINALIGEFGAEFVALEGTAAAQKSVVAALEHVCTVAGKHQASEQAFSDRMMQLEAEVGRWKRQAKSSAELIEKERKKASAAEVRHKKELQDVQRALQTKERECEAAEADRSKARGAVDHARRGQRVKEMECDKLREAVIAVQRKFYGRS